MYQRQGFYRNYELHGSGRSSSAYWTKKPRLDRHTTWPKNRYSRDIHEIDPQCDHMISRDIDFDLQRVLATRSYREPRRCRTEARYCTISHDRTFDQPHEFLGCKDFLAMVVQVIAISANFCTNALAMIEVLSVKSFS